MSVAVDAEVEPGRPDVAGSGWPVDHADLKPLEAAAHLHWKPGVVGRVAVDHGQRLPEPAQALQDRLLLPVPGVPHLVDSGEALADEVEQSIDAVPSLSVADEP